MTVLFVSHKLDECYAIGGEVIVLRDGQKMAQGPIADYTKAQISELMTGKHLAHRALSRTRRRVRGEVVLDVHGLGRGGQFARRVVRAAPRRNSRRHRAARLGSQRTRACARRRGAGRSGTVALDGAQIAPATPADAKRHRIGYVPEDRLNEGLFLDKPIRDNVITAMISSLRDRFGQIDRKRARALARTAP